ncbi:MAG: flippase [Candidatus Paceibacterota bacterium]|jgi:O-antigen/teichoic acid export membrane protein
MPSFTKNLKNFLLENQTTKQTIVKNTFWLTASSVFSKLFKYFLLIYAARLLGVIQYGYFNFAMSFAALFAVFSDLGISSIISRDLAKDKETEIKIPAIFTLKLLLVISSFLLIVFASFFAPNSSLLQKAIILMAIFVTLNSLSSFLYSCFYGREEMQYQTITEITENGMATVLGIYLLLHLPQATTLSFAYAVSAIVGFVVIFILFSKRFGRILKLQIDIKEWQRVFSLSWPLALSGIFALIYTYTDTVMLGFWKVFEQIGYYNAAQKIIALAIFPAALIITAFLPAFSRYSETDKQKTQTIFHYQNLVLLALAFPIVCGGYILANGLILHFYGANYLPAVLALKILLLMAGISYFSTSLGYALFVFNQQKKAFWAYLIGALLNVPLNAFLIPKYGFYGAAIATVITAFITFLVLVYLVKRNTPLKLINWFFIKYLLIIILATALMSLVLVFGAKYNFNVVLKVLGGGLVYLVIIGGFLLKSKDII